MRFEFFCGFPGAKTYGDLRETGPATRYGLIAQLVEYCTGIVEVVGSSPL